MDELLHEIKAVQNGDERFFDDMLDDCWHNSLNAYEREVTQRILDILNSLDDVNRYRVETYLKILTWKRERTIGDLMADGTFKVAR